MGAGFTRTRTSPVAKFSGGGGPSPTGLIISRAFRTTPSLDGLSSVGVPSPVVSCQAPVPGRTNSSSSSFARFAVQGTVDDHANVSPDSKPSAKITTDCPKKT